MTLPWSTSPAPCPSQVRLGLILGPGTPGPGGQRRGWGTEFMVMREMISRGTHCAFSRWGQLVQPLWKTMSECYRVAPQFHS